MKGHEKIKSMYVVDFKCGCSALLSLLSSVSGSLCAF